MRRPTAASNVAGQVGGSAPLELLARAGLTAYGLIHILVGWLALLMAWGGSAGESSDLSGALRTVARQPFGKIMLGQVAGGLVALALWQADRKGYMPDWLLNALACSSPSRRRRKRSARRRSE